MKELDQLVRDFLRYTEAVAYGVATLDTLKGGPPSTDISRVLPGARAAVSFALALDDSHIEPYLRKEDYVSLNEDDFRVNRLVNGIALELASLLDMLGHPSVAVAANNVYRKDTPRGALDELPEISHRYMAVRAGVGHFGLSGNVIRRPQGAAIILGTVVTSAELSPTAPLAPDDNYCDGCRICERACPSGFFDGGTLEKVEMGGVEFTYAKRRSHWRCDYVCGGFAGLHPSGRWSTWSPARFRIPERDEDFRYAIRKAIGPYINRPRLGPRFFHPLLPGHQGSMTCCHCQLVCHPDREVRKQRLKALTSSGVVIQEPDGSLRAVSPEEAASYLASMEPERRALYE